jgi:hypothetical protein
MDNNPFNIKTTVGVPFDATNLGIVSNTITGLPKATLQVGKDILQSTARGIASAGLSLSRFFANYGDITDYVPKELSSDNVQNTVGKEFFKTIFGDEPIKNIGLRIKENDSSIKKSEFAKSLGLDKYSFPLAFAGTSLSTGLDLLPFGGEKNVLKQLAKETDVVKVSGILKDIGVAEYLIKPFSEKIANTSSEINIKDILNISDSFNKLKKIEGASDIAYHEIKNEESIKNVKSNFLVDNLPQDIKDRQVSLDIRRQLLKENPASQLERYSPRQGDYKGTLKEVTGNDKSIFGRRGDSIVTELGFNDSEHARQAFDEYKVEKSSILLEDKKLRQDISNLSKRVIEKSSALPKSVQKIAVPQEEVKSLEITAKGVLDKIDEPFHGKISSLPDIVLKNNTLVKNKINLLDYLRTPDKVFEKIGFKKNIDDIRTAYSGYVKELNNINLPKISEWAKGFNEESNKNIFRYLDGKDIKLDDKELKTANEIKDWLREWAMRLKLPEDNRITNYITHIFDKEFIAKEFDEDLAKIIEDKIPGSVYDPFVLKRLGAKGYKEDTWGALEAYVNRGTRKVYMDDVLQNLKYKTGAYIDVSNIEASQFKFIQRYINGLNFRPTEFDNLLDNGIKSLVGYRFGQRPVNTITRLLRQVTSRGVLGGNVSSALRNLFQGLNTYSVLGEKYTVLGYLKLFSTDAIKEVKESGILGESFIQDRVLSTNKKVLQSLDKGLFSLFQSAEYINRGSAYFGAKARALSQGKNINEAIDYAKEVVRKTQFSFSPVDIPVALQSDIVKTLLHFQTYNVKQIEFLSGLVRDKNFIGLLRYTIAGLTFVYTIGKVFSMRPEELLPTLRFDTPPSLKAPVEVSKAILDTKDKYGNDRNLNRKLQDIKNSLLPLIPAGSQMRKTIQGIQATSAGAVKTSNNKIQYKVGKDLPNKIRGILFGKNGLRETSNYYNKKTTKKDNPFNLNK